MSTPMTPDREAEIRTRAEAATPGPWEEYPEYGKDFYAYTQGPSLRGVGTLTFGDGEDAAADRALTLNAREDILALAAELGRVRSELNQTCYDLTGANLARWEEENDNRRLRIAARNARQRAARLRSEQAEEKATTSTVATSTPEFFQPGHTYSDGNGYRAPELTRIFRVEHITRHPEHGFLRAIGWSRTGAPGAKWHGDFCDEHGFTDWHDITPELEPELTNADVIGADELYEMDRDDEYAQDAADEAWYAEEDNAR